MDTIIPAVQELLAAARAKRIPIVFTTTAYDVVAGPHSDSGLWHLKIPAEALQAGSEAVAIDERVAPLAGEQVIGQEAGKRVPRDLARGLPARGERGHGAAHGGDLLGLRAQHLRGRDRGGLPPDRGTRGRGRPGGRGLVEWNLFDMDAKFGDVEPLANVLSYLDRLLLENRSPTDP